jgi:hypothetical protein
MKADKRQCTKASGKKQGSKREHKKAGKDYEKACGS